jgi:hypothetical protein
VRNFRRVVIASHGIRPMIDLKPPFIELVRTIGFQNENSPSHISSIEGSNQSPELYSEYPVFWSQFPLPINVRTFGLYHYRCFLDLSNSYSETKYLSYEDLQSELDNQVEEIRKLRRKIVVSTPIDFSSLSNNVWEQFVMCHPDAEEDLTFACDYFYRLTGLDARKILISTNYLYSRNIFLGPRKFATDWNHYSRRILQTFEEKGFLSQTDRPGGYILERLFSVYAMQFEGHKNFETRNLIYFQ